MCEVEEGILINYEYLKKVGYKKFGNKSIELIEDLVHDTIVNALSYKDKFKGNNIQAWLCYIMNNVYYNKYRRSKALKEILKNHKYESINISINDGTLILGNSNVNNFLTEILDIRYFNMFQMIIEEYTYPEIAKTLNIPLGTVKSRVSFARKLLKTNIEKFEYNYIKENNLTIN